MSIGYLELVSTNPDSVCEAYSKIHGVEFSGPIPELGNARVISLPEGGRLGVRGQLRPDETPVVRPCLLVDDVAAAIEVAREAGAEIALGETEIPGQGTFGIFIHGGIESGVWQRD